VVEFIFIARYKQAYIDVHEREGFYFFFIQYHSLYISLSLYPCIPPTDWSVSILLTTSRPYSSHGLLARKGLTIFLCLLRVLFYIIHNIRARKEHIRPVLRRSYNLFVLHTITNDYVLRLKFCSRS